MVYLINSTDPQQVFIPKNEPIPANYKSQYEKGYDDGYAAGQSECPSCDVKDKSVVVSADTQTVYPDSGYAGMSSVDIDATDYGNGKYCEGYQGGYSEGEADQKARLSSATFVENGNYELENGWSAVTVQTTCPPPNLEDKNFYLESGFTPTTIRPSSGYDGLSSVRVEDNGYGQERYDAGVSAGEASQKARLSSTAFTQNGDYTLENGWSAVTVQVSGGTPCSLEDKQYGIFSGGAGTWEILPDSGYDGMSRVVITDEGYGTGKYNDGIAAQKALLASTAFTGNGIYTRTDGWDEVEVDVSYQPCVLQTKSDAMTATTQTFTADNLARPTAPSGETVYGGSIELLKDLIDQYGEITIMFWADEQHSSSYEIGYFQYDNGEYMWHNYQEDIPYPFSSLTSSFTNVGGVGLNYIYMKNDGLNIFFYGDNPFGMYVYRNITLNDLILTVDEYDGLSAITVSASAICQDAYDSGVTAQKGLLASTAFTENGTYTRADGWSSVTVNATVSAIAMYKTNDGQTFNMDLRKWNGSGYEDCVKENIYTGGVGFYIFNSNNIPVRIGIMAASLDDDETRLTWFKVPDGVNWIGSLAFASCSNLVEIVLPSSLTDITTDTFNGCNSLSTIYCYATTAPVLPTGTFDVAQSGTLLVPTGSDYSGWASALPSGWTISATL